MEFLFNLKKKFTYLQTTATPLEVNQYLTLNSDSSMLHVTADKLQADSAQM